MPTTDEEQLGQEFETEAEDNGVVTRLNWDTVSDYVTVTCWQVGKSGKKVSYMLPKSVFDTYAMYCIEYNYDSDIEYESVDD